MKGSKLTRAVCKTAKRLKRASPTVLTFLSAAGVVATTVLAVKATPKAIMLLETKEKDERRELNAFEKVYTAAPVYIPTVFVCAATITCILGANTLNRRQQASIASAYALLDQTYKQYKNAAKEVFGEKADEKIEAEVAKKVYVSGMTSITSTNLYDPDGSSEEDEVLFYDRFGGRFFTSTKAAVINAEYHVNRNLAIRGYVYLGEFYEFLGLSHIDGDNTIGWDFDRLLEEFDCVWLDFGNCAADLGDGTECFIVDTFFEPEVIPY